MFNWFFKSKASQIDLSRIKIDIHSHLIPGIDDGVETLEQSVEMLRKMQLLGLSEVYTTPHVMWDCYRNTPSIIQDGLAQVRQSAKDAGLSIRVNAAAEYFIDENFNNLLSTENGLLTLPGKRLLVELPYSTQLLNTPENLFLIVEKGFQPVLAHPERYTYFYSEPNIFKRFVDQGCELQLNILSLTGYYGANTQKMAEWLLENGLITFLGTDAHKIQHLELISKKNRGNWLDRYPFQNEKLLLS